MQGWHGAERGWDDDGVALAAALLEELSPGPGASAVDGDRASLGLRFAEATGRSEDELRRGIDPGTFERALARVAIDRPSARAIGRRWISDPRFALFVRSRNWTTPERALRNVSTFMALAPDERVTIESLEAGRAVLVLESPDAPAADGDVGTREKADEVARRVSEARDGLREGVLQGLPLVFGSPPAVVREANCRQSGDRVCGYDVRFEAELPSRWPVFAGLGAVVGFAASALLGMTSLWLANAVLAAVACGFAAACLATGVGLRARLDARVERLGSQPALLDAAEHLLSERVDRLAKLGGVLERAHANDLSDDEAIGRPSGTGLVPVHAPSPRANHSQRLVELAALAASHEHTLGELGDAALDDDAFAATDRGWQSKLEDATADAARLRGELSTLLREVARGAVGDDAALGSDSGSGGGPVDLASVAQTCVVALRDELPPAVQLSVVVDHGTDAPWVDASPEGLESLVAALIHGAVRACGGTARIELAVSVFGESGAGRVELTVSDNRSGEAALGMEEAFDPFEVPSQANGVAGGTGRTQLARCLALTEKLGGELRVEGRRDARTAMTVSFPRSSSGPATGDLGLV